MSPTSTSTDAKPPYRNMSTGDDQLEIMTALALIQLKWRISLLPVWDPPTITSERRSLYILNWIASFFVRDPKGDCITSALSVEDRKITLYIAANRG
ncbi:hypothetical protein BYT27DRAFT_7258511 [Phlegmacium glaucopus]|nr:hypothetical protein BYT27DRAFT_7258511 [Phlegmacium glaucopus]